MSCPADAVTLIKQFQTLDINDKSPIDNSCEPSIPFLGGAAQVVQCPRNGEFTTTVPSCGPGEPDYCTTGLEWGMEAKDVGFDVGAGVGVSAHWSDFDIDFDGHIGGDGTGRVHTGNPGKTHIGCNESPKAPYSFDISHPHVKGHVGGDWHDVDLSVGASSDFSATLSLPMTGCRGYCTRNSYKAPSAACCASNTAANTFYSDGLVELSGDISKMSEHTLVTCDPQFASFSSNTCDGPMAGLCSTPENYYNLGGIVDNTNFKQWKSSKGGTPGSCYNYAVASASESGKLLTLEQSLMSLNRKYPINALGDAPQDIIDAWLGIEDACSLNIGLCDATLSTICQGFTRDEISKAGENLSDPSNQILYAACACHLPATQYLDYAGIIEEGAYNECDPLCLGPSAIHKGTATGQEATCKETNCVIDDVTINIINSQTGDINFDQICGDGSGSNCYFSDINVFEEASTVGNIDMSQNCSACFVYSSDNPYNPTPIDCRTGGKPVPPVPTAGPGWSKIFKEIGEQLRGSWTNLQGWLHHDPKSTFPIVGVVVLVILLAFVLVLFFSIAHSRSNSKTSVVPKAPSYASQYGFE